MADGLPAPTYEYKMGFLYLTFTNERINELSEIEQKVYELICSTPDLRQSDLAHRLDITEQYVRKVIKQLKDRGLIERIGSRKKGYWRIRESR